MSRPKTRQHKRGTDRPKASRPGPNVKSSTNTPASTIETVVDETATCVCSHAPEEHGHDPAYPGSTSCNADECDCIAYEADPEAP